MKKSFGRIPTWKMFKESFSAQENEESFDGDLDATTPAEEGGDASADTSADATVIDDSTAPAADSSAEGEGDASAEDETSTDVPDELKTKILDLKDQLEGSDDEFTKEDMIKFLDELSSCCSPADETEGDSTEGASAEDAASGEEGDGSETDASGEEAEGDGTEADASGEGTEELSESKTTKKVKAPAAKLSVPVPAKAATHKKADVTPKVTNPKEISKKAPAKK